MKRMILTILFCSALSSVLCAQVTKDSIVDSRDGNVYEIVQIGSQWWMAENLAYLPAVNIPDEGSKSSPFYYVYDYFNSEVLPAKLDYNYKKQKKKIKNRK